MLKKLNRTSFWGMLFAVLTVASLVVTVLIARAEKDLPSESFRLIAWAVLSIVLDGLFTFFFCQYRKLRRQIEAEKQDRKLKIEVLEYLQKNN